MKIVAIFDNRTQSLLFSKNLKMLGGKPSIINTPREILASCGISVEFDNFDINKAIYIIKRNNFSAFKGFYKVQLYSNRFVYTKL